MWRKLKDMKVIAHLNICQTKKVQASKFKHPFNTILCQNKRRVKLNNMK